MAGSGNVILFGHSFIRRLGEFMELSNQENLGLSVDKCNVTCLGFVGLCLQQRQKLHYVDRKLQGADLVLIEIGSNDLCNRNYNPETFANDLFSYAMFLLEGLNVRTVVIS